MDAPGSSGIGVSTASASAQHAAAAQPAAASATASTASTTASTTTSPPPPQPPQPRKTVPRLFHHIQVTLLERMIADMLAKITKHNDRIPVTQSSLTRFHSRAAPAISISDYLRRIVQFASVEKACLLILLVYIDRICERNANFNISSLTIHRFIIVAVTVAAKISCDSYCTNSHYARVGGISTQELNTLEIEFVFLMNWRLACDVDLLQNYYEHLVDNSGIFERNMVGSGAGGGAGNAGSSVTGSVTGTGNAENGTQGWTVEDDRRLDTFDATTTYILT